MSDESNGNNMLRVAPESVDFTVTIHHNVITKQFSVDGFGENMLVARVMCEHAAEMIKREMLKLEMAAQMRNGPRLVMPDRRGL